MTNPTRDARRRDFESRVEGRELKLPAVSVVMPVKNALPYLDAAIRSILTQTFVDFEFVIRDDGSTDGSCERLRYWAATDDRIRLFEGKQCLGPAGSSNWVVRQARAPIVARMDADDISLPDRLRRQLEILRNNDDAALVGSVWEGIDRDGKIVREPDLRALRTATFAAPFTHGSIMFRRERFEQAGGYRAECDFWEDLDLFLRMASTGRVLVSTEPLYQHRFSDTSTRLNSQRSHVEQAVDLMFTCRDKYERGEDYADLLAKPLSGAKTTPSALLSLAFITFWSGTRPAVLLPLLRRGRLTVDLATLKALIWALWAEVSPRSLRSIMRLLVRYRSAKVRKSLGSTTVWEWRASGLPVRESDAEVSRASRYA